jgi:cobalt transporter subunit CbtB
MGGVVMVSLASFARKLISPRSVAIPSRTTIARLCAAILGIVLVYGTGFAQTEEIHNGAHDTRHSSGFPCH